MIRFKPPTWRNLKRSYNNSMSSTTHWAARHLYVPRAYFDKLPTELWGAVNVVAIAVSKAKPGFRRQRSSRIASTEEGAQQLAAPVQQKLDTVAQLLDYQPQLSLFEVLICLAATVVICVAYYSWQYGLSQPLSLRVGITVALLATACLTVLRNAFLELQYQAIQRPESKLGDPDSLFLPINSVTVHAKVKRGVRQTDGQPWVAVHCYHGFGANTYSWERLLTPLADDVQGQVSCHDMPGFGLTSRPKDLRCYTLSFNGALGRAVMEQQLTKWKHGEPGQEFRVLVGHSLGSACVAAEVINNPKGIGALVLIAPAIVASKAAVVEAVKDASPMQQVVTGIEEAAASPASASPPVQDAETGNNNTPTTQTTANVTSTQPTSANAASTTPASSTSSTSNSTAEGSKSAFGLTGAIGHLLLPLVVAASRVVLLFLRPVLVLLLRTAVRTKDFWAKGLQGAWYNKAGVTTAVVDGYRLPQLVSGWEAGMLRFLLARMSILSPLWKGMYPPSKGVEGAEGGPSQLEKLEKTVQEYGIKVLILHGEQDALVPLSNSRALAAKLPNTTLMVVPNCGHVPQEEHPEDIANRITTFVGALLPAEQSATVLA